MLSVHAPSKV